MLLEHQYHLHCEPHAITDVPYSYANGFEDRTLQTRVYRVELSIRHVRGSDRPFRPAPLESVMVSEKALRTALA